MERKVVKVGCSQPGGLQIRLYGAQSEEGGMPSVGGRVTLNGPSSHSAGANNPSPTMAPAYTEVDAAFWKAWTDQNRGKNAMLDSGLIYEIKEDQAPEGERSAPEYDADGKRLDGPTVEQWVRAGYSANHYPPSEYASRSSAEDIQAAIDAERADDAGSSDGSEQRLDDAGEQVDQSGNKPGEQGKTE